MIDVVRPTLCDRRCATDVVRPTLCDRRCAIDVVRSTLCDRRCATGSGVPRAKVKPVNTYTPDFLIIIQYFLTTNTLDIT